MRRWWIALVACGFLLAFLARPVTESRTLNEKAIMTEEEKSGLAKATFGAGCFWCVEATFQQLDGVKSVTSGYAGGQTKEPTYKQVCTGNTGHAEVVEILFNPQEVTYEQLLEVFWISHNPTQLNRQGADVGTQYRSTILFHSDEQREAAVKSKDALTKSGKYKKPVVTEIVSASEFFKAEAYHQNYVRNNPYSPYSLFTKNKLKKLRLNEITGKGGE